MNNKDILLNKDIEILTSRESVTEIKYFNENIVSYNIANNTTYKLKAKLNNKFVTLTTESLDNPEALINDLEEKSILLENTDDSSFASKQLNTIKDIVKEDKKFSEIKTFLESLGKLKDNYKEVFSIESLVFEVKSETNIENKKVKLNNSNVFYQFYIEVIVRNELTSIDERVEIIDKTLDFNKVKNETITMIENTIKRLNSGKATTRTGNILLTSNAVHDIFKEFTTMFNAKNIKDNISPLSNKFNKEVFNKKISIIEDPTNESYPTKYLFDTEGTPTYKKEIIKEGKFITKLYDNQTAKLENTNSTGNSYGVRNLIIVPGTKSIKELEKQLEEGFIITNVEGTHAGIMPKTGSISVQARGINIKNNKKEYIEQLILSTNIFELLNNVLEVGNDLNFHNLTIATPSLLLKDIMIISN